MPTTSSETVEIIVNGERKIVHTGLTVATLLPHLGVDPERVAIELDRSIVRRERRAEIQIGSGAQLEIVQFVGGG